MTCITNFSECTAMLESSPQPFLSYFMIAIRLILQCCKVLIHTRVYLLVENTKIDRMYNNHDGVVDCFCIPLGCDIGPIPSQVLMGRHYGEHCLVFGMIGPQGTSMCRRSPGVHRIPYKSGQFFSHFLKEYTFFLGFF
jgi:hypothetical protein